MTYFRHALYLTLWAFILNLIWEYVQCPLFFVHAGVRPTHAAMLVATCGDVALTWIAQGILALGLKRWFWSFERWGIKIWTILLSTAVAFASLVELRAVSTGRWSYTSINPLVPGTPISLIPLVQLALLSPLAFYLARRTMRKMY